MSRGILLKHPAQLFRCWCIVDEGDGTFTGELRSRTRRLAARTERGDLALVRMTIEHCYQHRGAPSLPYTVMRKRAAA